LPPSAPSSPSPLSPFSETEKIRKSEFHIGLHLKSVISRVANSVVGYTLRPVETRPESPRAGGGVLGSWQRVPSPSVREPGGAL